MDEKIDYWDIDTDGWDEDFMSIVNELGHYFTPEHVDLMIEFIDHNESGLFFDLLVDGLWIKKAAIKKSTFKRMKYYFPFIGTENRSKSMDDLEKLVIPD